MSLNVTKYLDRKFLWIPNILARSIAERLTQIFAIYTDNVHDDAD